MAREYRQLMLLAEYGNTLPAPVALLAHHDRERVEVTDREQRHDPMVPGLARGSFLSLMTMVRSASFRSRHWIRHASPSRMPVAIRNSMMSQNGALG